MAVQMCISEAAMAAMLDAFNTHVGSGATLRFYSGTAPTDCETALSGNTLLAQVSLNSTPFSSATTGTNLATLALDVTGGLSDTDADAAGTASFARIVKSDGTTVALQGNVATSAAAFTSANITIAENGTVTVQSWSFSQSTGDQF